MKVSEIGEFGTIDVIDDLIRSETRIANSAGKDLLIGIGDDTAVWKCRGKMQLATTDVLVQDVHFSLEHISWDELGYKAIAVNLSDIAAMGGTPQYALISLCLPGNTDVDDVKKLYHGMLQITNRFDTLITGGNIASAEKITINVTIHGYAGNRILTRSAAFPGDTIAITGPTGLSRAGLMALQSQMMMEPRALKLLRAAHNRPEPKIEFGRMLTGLGVKAAIDISDGLVADLKHVCRLSNVSARIEMEKVPLHELLKQYFHSDAVPLALAGGEDYELLFTAPDKVMKKVKSKLPGNSFTIGTIEAGVPGTVHIVDSSGNEISLEESGWDHFR